MNSLKDSESVPMVKVLKGLVTGKNLALFTQDVLKALYKEGKIDSELVRLSEREVVEKHGEKSLSFDDVTKSSAV